MCRTSLEEVFHKDRSGLTCKIGLENDMDIPEHIVLDEERVGGGLEDEVLHEGLGDVLVRLGVIDFKGLRQDWRAVSKRTDT